MVSNDQSQVSPALVLDIRWLEFLCSGLFCFTLADGLGCEEDHMHAFSGERADLLPRVFKNKANTLSPLN